MWPAGTGWRQSEPDRILAAMRRALSGAVPYACRNRAMQAMLGMRKLDIAALERARKGETVSPG